jgi:predicted transposase YbfD/YdcC
MQIFLSAFDDIPDPRADNARHDLGELLVIAFVDVLCGATTCAGMATFGRAKESLFRDFLNLKHAIPSHDTFSTVFRMLDPKALDAAFGKLLADVSALMRDGDVIAIDGKALRGARGKAESARTRMMVSAYAARLRLTLASRAADNGTELDAALEVLGLVALKGKVVTGDALHCNRRTVAAINEGGGDWCLALKANQDSLLSDARACFGKVKNGPPVAITEDSGHGRKEKRTAMAVPARGLAEHHEFPGLRGFGRIQSTREIDGRTTSETRIAEARDRMTVSLRSSFDRLLKEAHSDGFFEKPVLEHAETLRQRVLREIPSLGGAPIPARSEEGHLLWLGGTDESREMADIERSLGRFVANSSWVNWALETEAALDRRRAQLASG